MSSEKTHRELSLLIKKRSASLGFDLTGIAKARALSEYEHHLKGWVAAGMHDKMNYLSRDTEKRADPSILFPGVRSIVVTGLNYYTEVKQVCQGVPVISRYAYGRTYQDVIGEKLAHLLEGSSVSGGEIVGNNKKLIARVGKKIIGHFISFNINDR